MSKVKAVLIIGGSGFVGTHLALRLRDTHKVFATYFTHRIAIPGITYIPFNVENRDYIKRVAYGLRPDVIVFAAGNPDLGWAELNRRHVEAVQVGGVANLSNVFDIVQPKLIFLSSCYAFDGARGNYHENEVVFPGSVLGKGKIGGENIVRSKSLNHVIVRSSPVLGRGNALNPSLLDRIRMKLDRKEKVEMSPYEYHSFASVYGLVDLLAQVVDGGVRNRVLHYGGLTKLNFYEMARIFAARFGYDQDLVIPKRNMNREVLPVDQQAEDYSLNSTQTVQALKIKPLLIEECFDLIDQKLVSRP